jgi:uncharacterized protein GlcG (DUF336 family)
MRSMPLCYLPTRHCVIASFYLSQFSVRIMIRPRDGMVMGGIGVGGYPSGQADEDLARVGLRAMNL